MHAIKSLTASTIPPASAGDNVNLQRVVSSSCQETILARMTSVRENLVLHVIEVSHKSKSLVSLVGTALLS